MGAGAADAIARAAVPEQMGVIGMHNLRHVDDADWQPFVVRAERGQLGNRGPFRTRHKQSEASDRLVQQSRRIHLRSELHFAGALGFAYAVARRPTLFSLRFPIGLCVTQMLLRPILVL